MRICSIHRSTLFGLLLAVFACQVTDAVAQPGNVEVAVQANPTSATVGQPIQLILEVTVTELSRLTVDAPFVNEKASTWTITGNPVSRDTQLSDNRWRRRIVYPVTTFEIGEIETPPIEIIYQTPLQEVPDRRFVPAATVQIASVLEGEQEAALRDIKPPLEVPLPAAVRWGAIAAVAALAAVLVFFLWRKLRRKMGAAAAASLPPDEWALEELKRLEDERLVEQKKLKEYYTRLADTLRGYVGQVYQLPTEDMTTGELLYNLESVEDEEKLSHRPALNQARKTVEALLTEADLVKFAKFLPEAAKCRHALERSREVVRLTRHRLEPEPEATTKPEASHGQKAGVTAS